MPLHFKKYAYLLPSSGIHTCVSCNALLDNDLYKMSKHVVVVYMCAYTYNIKNTKILMHGERNKNFSRYITIVGSLYATTTHHWSHLAAYIAFSTR